MQERPDLSEMKSNLMVNNARMKAELSLLEDTILQMLSASQGNILDDENLINTLAVSKVYNAAVADATLACKRLHCNYRNTHLPSAMQCI
jgi:dynein heavy chain